MALINLEDTLSHITGEKVYESIKKDTATGEAVADITAHIIDNAVFAGLEDFKLNSGLSFLEGKTTSVFNALANDTKGVMNIANDLVQNKPQEVAQIISNATTQIIGNITENITGYVMEKTLSIMDPAVITSRITEYTTYYTQMCTKGLPEILSSFVIKQDTKFLDDAKKEKKEKHEARLNKVKSDIAKTKAFVSYWAPTVQNGIEMAFAYYKMGPQWVENQISSYVNFATNYATSYIGLATEQIIAARDNAIDEYAKVVGNYTASLINKAAESAAKKQLTEASVKCIAALSKAASLLMSAAQASAASLGNQLGAVIKMAAQKGIEVLMKQVEGGIQKAQESIVEGLSKSATLISDKAKDTMQNATDKVNGAINLAQNIVN